MGKALFDASAAARRLFESASSVLGFDLASVCFGGPQERLNQTDVSQPAIYVTGVASYRDAVEKGLFDASAVAAYAGLSLGEYTALHLAGVFEFEQGLHLVAQRGRYMQDAAVASPSGMVALIGADEAAALSLCEKAAQGEVLVPANFNAPGQIVLSGTSGACRRVLEMSETAGIRATELKVAGAFHSPLMADAAEKMKVELAGVDFASPRQRVYSNVTAQPHGQAESIKKRLVEQIVSPVRWEQTMVALLADAEAKLIELSPGRTLAGLAKRINRRLAVRSLEQEIGS
jgi:[acyl-carrier-protein] S-malonyltransferase